MGVYFEERDDRDSTVLAINEYDKRYRQRFLVPGPTRPDYTNNDDTLHTLTKIHTLTIHTQGQTKGKKGNEREKERE